MFARLLLWHLWGWFFWAVCAPCIFQLSFSVELLNYMLLLDMFYVLIHQLITLKKTCKDDDHLLQKTISVFFDFYLSITFEVYLIFVRVWKGHVQMVLFATTFLVRLQAGSLPQGSGLNSFKFHDYCIYIVLHGWVETVSAFTLDCQSGLTMRFSHY